MKEFQEVARWFDAQGCQHEVIPVSSLPDPTFEMDGRKFVSFSTNNYLALATSPRLIEAARRGLDRFGVGNCESRLLGGDLDVYRQLESKLAALKRKEAALIFATGYLTNLGVLSSLVKAPQVCRFYGFRPSRRYRYAYFSDELNHISIREGIRMSEAERISYRHLDLNHLESLLRKSDADVKIIVSDGVFSQDGDIAPLPELVALADRYDATVYIDDAHGTGVLGATGGGISEHFGCYSPRMIHMGTLSKAYGAIGGFIAADRSTTHILQMTCTAFGFTSTLPPDQAYAVCEAMDMVRDEPERRESLWRNQEYFVSRVESLGYSLVSKKTPIVPILLHDEKLCDAFSAEFHRHGFHIDPVKFPAVAKGKARLRFILNAHHTHQQIDALADVLESLARRYPQAVEGERAGLEVCSV